MNDRIPGSCPHNPIHYKGWKLAIHDPETPGEEWEFWYEDALLPQFGVMQRGTARTEVECKRIIDSIRDSEVLVSAYSIPHMIKRWNSE